MRLSISKVVFLRLATCCIFFVSRFRPKMPPITKFSLNSLLFFSEEDVENVRKQIIHGLWCLMFVSI